jgi:hypothetical protein
VGYSTSPHLHFHVMQMDTSGYHMIRSTFADVDKDAGIPRTLHRYTSGNVLQ